MDTGDYIIYYYDHRGTRIRDLTETCSCGIVGAEAIAEDMLVGYKILDQQPLPVSFAIDRRCRNSTDTVKTW